MFKFLCLVENHGRYRGNDSRHPLSIDLVHSGRLVTCPGLLLKTFGSRDIKTVFRIGGGGGGGEDLKLGKRVSFSIGKGAAVMADKDLHSISWVKVFRIIPEFRILRPTFHRKSASKC